MKRFIIETIKGLSAKKIVNPQRARIKKQNEIDLKKYKPAND